MTLRSTFIAVACALTSACSGGDRPAATTAATARPGDLAIVDVTVVPMSSDGVLAHHTVVIRGDRIVAVAPVATLAVPAGVTRIEGAGKWLMPGLADMHVHAWRDDELAMFVAAGVTTIRNMWGIPQHVAWRDQIARGERLGPTIVTAGPLVDGDPPDWPGSVVIARPDEAQRIVAAHVTGRYDFVKSVARLTPESYTALAAEVRRNGLVLVGHVPIAVGLAGALAAHQHSVEHLDGYLEALVPPGPPLPPYDDLLPWLHAVLDRRDLARLPSLIEQTIAAGTWNCPTLIANDRLAEIHGDDGLDRRVQWLDLVPAAQRARWGRDFRTRHASADETASLRAINALLAQITVALAGAKAPILVGTDTGGPYVVAGEGLHDEIEMLVAAGVPRPRVLRAATADAWRFLGHPHEAGVVEPGARADLILVATDPFAAPLPLVPDAVAVRGRWLPRAELLALLAPIRARAPAVDPWRDAPPLAGATRYDTMVAGTLVSSERVRDTGGEIVGQIVDLGGDPAVESTLRADGLAVDASWRGMTTRLRGTIAKGMLAVTGTDLGGRAVTLREPVPAGGLVMLAGATGTARLAGKLAGMRPGDKRVIAVLALDYYPRIALAAERYDVARVGDRDGHRVYLVTAIRGTSSTTTELAIDDAGVVTRTLAEREEVTRRESTRR